MMNLVDILVHSSIAFAVIRLDILVRSSIAFAVIS